MQIKSNLLEKRHFREHTFSILLKILVPSVVKYSNEIWTRGNRDERRADAAVTRNSKPVQDERRKIESVIINFRRYYCMLTKTKRLHR